MELGHNEIMELIRKDTKRATYEEKPKYVVSSGRVAMPFTNYHLAFYWQKYMEINEVETAIIDLTNYDWEVNEANIKFHNTGTEEGTKDFFRTIENRTILN